ncbi:MAG: hypothetical protein ACTHOJ_08205 [Sphingomonas oligoaromativorans]
MMMIHNPIDTAMTAARSFMSKWRAGRRVDFLTIALSPVLCGPVLFTNPCSSNSIARDLFRKTR